MPVLNIKNSKIHLRQGTNLFKNSFEKGYHDHFLYREANNSQRNRARLNVLLKYKRTGSLLEIGCGKAGFLRLAEKYFQVEGMDISHLAIEAIRAHFGGRVRVANLDTDPITNNHYEVIAIFNTLEHLHNPGKVIQKIASALKPDGVVMGSVPNNFGLVGGFVTRLGNFFDRTHIATFPPDIWRQLFQQAGFHQITFFGETLLGRNHSIYLRHRWWPYFSYNLMFVCQLGK